MREVRITENEAGQRLDKYLAKYMSTAPKSFFYKMLRKKNIILNGKKAAGSEKLLVGDVVKLFLSDETIESFMEEQKKITVKASLDIIYEDDHIVLINKPEGMLSQKAKPSDVSLTEYLISYLLEEGCLTETELKTFHPSVCNRLDRNTSGMVIAGKSLVGLQKMSEVLKDRSLHKYYLCIVQGILNEEKEIAGYLLKDEKTNCVHILKDAQKDAKEIHTKYRPIAENGRETLLEVELLTGRAHQIRAHLSSIGHPILGDAKYGKKAGYTQMLHAYRLVMPKLDAPFFNVSEREFLAPVPGKFEELAKTKGLGKWQHGIPEV